MAARADTRVVGVTLLTTSPLPSAGEAAPAKVTGVDDETTPPLLKVVRGEPTADELAALVVAVSLAGKAAAGARATPEPPSAWASYWRGRRAVAEPGQGAWRASAFPARPR